MKYFFNILLVFCIINVQSQNTINNIFERKTTSLNGDWNYIVDPYETGFYSFHGVQYDEQKDFQKSAFFNNYHAQNKQELVEYDFDKSPVMKIPNDWNTQDPKLFYYEGNVWFKKTFDYQLSPGKRLFLYFGAVNYKADVYINGQKLGQHEGGFTSFTFEVTSLIKPKENTIVIKVDNTRHPEDVPAINTDWWNYGGITRDVLLIEEPQDFIQKFSIQLDKENENLLTGFVEMNTINKQNHNLTIEIPELRIKKNITVNNSGYSDFKIPVKNITRWSPENPKLYNVILSTENEKITDQIGFRTIKTSGNKILLNNKEVFLKGICMHEESTGKGRAYSKEDAQKLLSWAKELGCNYIRLAHYPHNENMVKEADRLGLMVWEEIPVYWTIDFANPKTEKNAENQLKFMIERDASRASVIIWSVANETPVSDQRNKFLIKLINTVKDKDNSRLVSCATLTRQQDEYTMIDDPIGEYLDVIAFNEYFGWYGGNLENAEKTKWKTIYNKPLVVSEFGGGAKQGLHGLKTERWTEEYQEYLYQENLKMIMKIPNIVGISPWILVDFRSPKRLLPDVQDGYNRKGIISETGTKKKAFYLLQEFYKKN